MSQSNSNSGSGAPSPEAQFHNPAMNRSDSPNIIDFNANHNESDLMLRSSHHHQHIDDNHHQDSESFFSHGGVQSMYNTSNNFHLVSEYLSDTDNFPLKQSLAGSTPNDFGAGPFRSSLSAYNGINGGNASNTGATGSYRVRQPDGHSQHFSNANDILGSHQSLSLQQQLSQQSQQGVSRSSAFESRSGFDFGTTSPLGGGKTSQLFSSLDPFLQAHSTKGHPQSQVHDTYHPLSHSNSASQMPYLNGMHLQSQTPYGPHLQSNGGAAGVPASNTRPMGSSGQINLNVDPQTGNSGQPEEISTIFVVGFPDDMQEREFQNMFTFSPGFEAATLKIPNKEYTAYGSVGGTTSSTPSGLPLRGSAYTNYLGAGSNDPYNVVTVNQGGVVIDNGRDGPTTSWPPLAMPLDEPSHFQVGQGLGQLPRKQIIGFAKFRTRQEALEARDLLQGRRVDIEKGAILKAEMAKKNLHTKRGVGMGATTSGSGGSISLGSGMPNVGNLSGGMGSLSGLGNNADVLANFAGLNLNNNLSLNNLAALSGCNPDILPGRERERELNAAGLGGSGWREGRLGESSEDERDRRREALSAMGVGLGLMRGARERAQADEEERVRRSKDLKQFQTDASRMMPGNTAAFEAFHSISAPTLSRHSQSGLLSPAGGSVSLSGLAEGGGNGPSPLLGSGYGNIIAQTGRDGANNVAAELNGHRESRNIGPWDVPSPREREGPGIPHALSSLYAARKSSMMPGRPPSPQQESPPHSNTAFSPNNDDDVMLPPHRSGALRSLYPLSPQVDEPLHLQTQPQLQPIPPSNNSSSSIGVLEVDRPVLLAVSTNAQPSAGSTGTGSPQLPSPASQSGSTSSSGGVNGGGSATSVGGTNVGAGPRNVVVDQNPPINTLYVGNLPTGSVGSGYPAGFLEESLRDLFARRPGFRKLCFRQKSNGPMCFVEFEDVHYATKALSELYGNTLGGIVKNGGIRLSYSKNPLGVRTPTSAGTSTSSLQQQQGSAHSGVASPFPPESYQARHPFDVDTSMGVRRDSSTAASLAGAYNYSRSPPPPRFFSPPPSANLGIVPTASAGNATAFPRGSQAFGLPSPNGASSNFSPFGLPLSSPRSRANGLPPSHTSIPDQSSEASLAHDHPQHFPHRALSPSSTTLEAARAG